VASPKENDQTMKHAPGFLKLVDDAKSRVRQIDIEGYKKMVAVREPHVLVDTREDREWADGRVAGAVHLSKGIIERDIETLYPDKTVELVLYCGGGFRSALAADNLQKMGYSNVISLDGGWRALKESGLALEK
jgi:rhodanese-related sulfurtransferase